VHLVYNVQILEYFAYNYTVVPVCMHGNDGS